MTEPVISDEEIEAFLSPLRARDLRDAVRDALAAFLAKRVPGELDAEVEKFKADGFTPREVLLVCLSHNACREAVLTGKK